MVLVEPVDTLVMVTSGSVNDRLGLIRDRALDRSARRRLPHHRSWCQKHDEKRVDCCVSKILHTLSDPSWFCAKPRQYRHVRCLSSESKLQVLAKSGRAPRSHFVAQGLGEAATYHAIH